MHRSNFTHTIFEWQVKRLEINNEIKLIQTLLPEVRVYTFLDYDHVGNMEKFSVYGASITDTWWITYQSGDLKRNTLTQFLSLNQCWWSQLSVFQEADKRDHRFNEFAVVENNNPEIVLDTLVLLPLICTLSSPTERKLTLTPAGKSSVALK